MNDDPTDNVGIRPGGFYEEVPMPKHLQDMQKKMEAEAIIEEKPNAFDKPKQ